MQYITSTNTKYYNRQIQNITSANTKYYKRKYKILQAKNTKCKLLQRVKFSMLTYAQTIDVEKKDFIFQLAG